MIKNVRFIYGPSYDQGCGVVIDDLLITAGHVIAAAPDMKTFVEGHQVKLDNPLLMCSDKHDDGLDLAVFRLPYNEQGENITFMQSLPEAGSHLVSMSLTEKQDGPSPVITQVKVLDTSAGNYYAVESDVQLGPGCSGSPLFSDHKLAGIIVAGNLKDDGGVCLKEFSTRFCWVLSAKVIFDKLKSEGILY